MISVLFRQFSSLFVLVSSFLFFINVALAAPRLIKPGDTFPVEIELGKGKKVVTHEVDCLGKVPGKVRETGKGLIFDSYSKTIKNQTKKIKKLSSQDSKKAQKKKRKLKKELKKNKKIKKAATRLCVSPPESNLDRFKGAFGETEARILYDRFAFGATPAEIKAAVQAGLEATVTQLTTYIAEPELDAYIADLECDGRTAEDEDNESCNPADPNDFYTPGFRYGLYSRFRSSKKPFFLKFFMFLHDERMAVSARVLDSYDRYALKDHVAMLRQAAISGDYRQLMFDWSTDYLGHLVWLDGQSNLGRAPNENFAREFWELGTTGTSNLDGSPVYTDSDLNQSALAFSGWTVVSHKYYDQNGDKHYIRYSAYSEGLHAEGAKTVFAGSPWQSVVYNGEDVVEATLNHPRTAEHLAEDLWQEFIGPEPHASGVQKLAAYIKSSNFNLMPVLKRIMMSKALYKAENRNSLIKHPVDLLFGFLRATGYPLSYKNTDKSLERLGQRPTLPNSVFGWNEKRLAGEAYVLSWRNVVLDLMNLSEETMLEKGFDLRKLMLSGLTNAQPTTAVVERVASWLGVNLNSAQKGSLDQYLNYHREKCDYWEAKEHSCTEGEYFLKRKAFDVALDAESYYHTKLQGLMAIIMALPEYRLK